MAKKQTRRSISVAKSTYDLLKAHCDANGLSMSRFIEERVGDALGYKLPPARKPTKSNRWNRPEPPVVEPVPANLPTAAEMRKVLTPPPPTLVRKPLPVVAAKKPEPPKEGAQPGLPVVHPDKIFTF